MYDRAGDVGNLDNKIQQIITILNTKNKGRHNKFGFGLKTFLPGSFIFLGISPIKLYICK